MGSPKTLWRLAADDLLASGPRPYGEVVRVAAAHVPPSMARRRRESERQRHERRSRSQGRTPARPRDRTADEEVMIGAFSIANQTVNSAIRDGAYIVEGGTLRLR